MENEHNSSRALTVAAELGSALMCENQQLKSNNDLLQARLASLEAQVEELNDQTVKLLSTQERLQDLLQEANKQNNVLKLRRDEDLKMFEDNDCERLKIINALDTKIQNLEAQNLKLKSDLIAAHKPSFSEGTTSSAGKPQEKIF